MKKAIILFFASILLTGCEDVIEIDVPSSQPRLIIDANFNVFTQENPMRLEGGARLTLSADFFDQEVPVVNDASVFLTDLGTGTQYPLVLANNDGLYLPRRVDIFDSFETTYELTVIYDNQTYVGVAKFIPTAPIDTVTQGTKTLFNGDETEVIVTFKDDGNRDDYYLYDFGFDLFRPLEDRFFQGEDFVFSQFYDSDDVKAGDVVTIKTYGIDQQYFTYIELVIEQAGEGGSPFGSAPATTRGNMINTTIFDNYPLGYFLISEANEMKLEIQDL